MVTQSPYGGSHGRAVVASETCQMLSGAVPFDAEDGRTGHFRPSFKLDYDRPATERRAAERAADHEAQQTLLLQRDPATGPAASPGQPKRAPDPKPPSGESGRQDPGVHATTPDLGSNTER